MIEILKAILLGIVQGITEWLPISSTGHMVLINEFIQLDFSETFVNTFMVVVQLGSILAVLVLFFDKLNPFTFNKTYRQKKETLSLWGKVIVASIPAGIFGVLFEDLIEGVLRGPIVIAIALIVYGIIFIFIDYFLGKPKVRKVEDLTYLTAFFIGCFQTLALIPGTSRSGSTIIGAMILGTSRYVASEFSFYLAIPVMFGASFLKLLKAGFAFSLIEWGVLLVGSVVAFGVSLFAIKFLLNYVRKHDFKAFGYYRIVLGILVIIYFTLFA